MDATFFFASNTSVICLLLLTRTIKWTFHSFIFVFRSLVFSIFFFSHPLHCLCFSVKVSWWLYVEMCLCQSPMNHTRSERIIALDYIQNACILFSIFCFPSMFRSASIVKLSLYVLIWTHEARKKRKNIAIIWNIMVRRHTSVD